MDFFTFFLISPLWEMLRGKLLLWLRAEGCERWPATVQVPGWFMEQSPALHRTSFVAAGCAPGSPRSNNTLPAAAAEATHSWTHVNASIHTTWAGHLYSHSCFSAATVYCGTWRQNLGIIVSQGLWQILASLVYFFSMWLPQILFALC